jgi:hypothetical protein
MSRPSRVRSVRLRTLGSATRLRDEFPVPRSLYYGGRGVAWAVKHWKVSGPVTVLLVAWSGAGIRGVLLFGVLGGACLFGWLRWHRRADGAAGSGKLNVEDMRHRLTLQKQWGLACRTGKLLGPETGDPPPLRQVRGDGHGTFTATVKCGEVGVPVFAVEKQTAALAEVIGCREVVVSQVRPGVARLAFHWRDPIGRALPLAAVPISNAAPGEQIAYGIRQDGGVATVNATQSILIGGLTRKGKSNLIWMLLADLLRQGVYVDLYVSDPKGGVELDQLEAQLDVVGPRLLRVRQYAKTAAETVKMLEAAEKGMHARQYFVKQQGGVRKIAPDQTNPLVVTILDETLPLTDILKKGTDSPLGRIAYTGAAMAYVVWANTQVAQVDALGRFRDLVPQRICFATPNPQVTDSVLGQGSETMGAYCSDIQEAGVGYSHSEGDKVARKFRAGVVTDDETQLIAQGMLPPAVVNKAREAWDRAAEGPQSGKSRGARRTALYRWYYVDDPEYGNSLGYVGISYDVIHREAQHTAGLRAFMEGNVRRETQWFPSRGEAVAAEALAIAQEKPIWNKQHNGGNSRRRIDRFRRDKVA